MANEAVPDVGVQASIFCSFFRCSTQLASNSFPVQVSAYAKADTKTRIALSVQTFRITYLPFGFANLAESKRPYRKPHTMMHLGFHYRFIRRLALLNQTRRLGIRKKLPGPPAFPPVRNI